METELAGIDILKIRNAFRKFNDLPMNFELNRDPQIIPKKLDLDTLSSLLKIDKKNQESFKINLFRSRTLVNKN